MHYKRQFVGLFVSIMGGTSCLTKPPSRHCPRSECWQSRQWEDCTGPRPTSSKLPHNRLLLSRHPKQSTSGLRLLVERLKNNKTSSLLDDGARNHPINDPFFAVRVGVLSWARLTLTMPASVTNRETRPNSVHMVEMCWGQRVRWQKQRPGGRRRSK